MLVVSLLRGVNVGAHNRIQMEPLRELYESLGLRDVRTLLQSGNVVFQCRSRDLVPLAGKLEDAFESRFGFRSAVILRTAADLQKVAKACPFTGPEIDPARLAVTFLAEAPDADCPSRLAALTGIREQIHAGVRELYIYYPDGMARPTLTAAILDKALRKITTTSRNWNTVNKLIALARTLEEP